MLCAFPSVVLACAKATARLFPPFSLRLYSHSQRGENSFPLTTQRSRSPPASPHHLLPPSQISPFPPHLARPFHSLSLFLLCLCHRIATQPSSSSNNQLVGCLVTGGVVGTETKTGVEEEGLVFSVHHLTGESGAARYLKPCPKYSPSAPSQLALSAARPGWGNWKIK